MNEVTIFRYEDMIFEYPHQDDRGESVGTQSIARLVCEDHSTTIGAGLARYDGCTVDWTLLYDEVIAVLGGIFRMRYGDPLGDPVELMPGDVVWLKKGTRMTYEGDAATIFYAVYPVDWRSKHALGEL